MAAPFLPRVRGFDANTSEIEARGIFGAALAMDWRQALIARGFGWLVENGTLTTPITGGGTGVTVLDLEQPQLVLNIPSGLAMVPLRISIEAQIGLQTTDAHVNELWIGYDRTQVQSNVTSTSVTPSNMRTDLGGTTAPFTARTTYTADGVATPLINTLARKQASTDLQGLATNMNVYQFDLIYEPVNPPMICGPANISLYWGGSIALPAFSQAYVLAFPSNLLTVLS